MPSRKKTAFGDFYQSVLRVTSTKIFNQTFDNLCRKSDRCEIIKILMDIDEVNKLHVEESYKEKNDKEARKIWEKYQTVKSDDRENAIFLRISFLTKALFAATSDSILFREILLERAGRWFSMGAFARCVKDCNFLMTLLTPEMAEILDQEISRCNEIRMECNLLRSKCSESLKRSKKIMEKNDRKNANAIISLPKLDGKSNSKLPSCSDSVTLSYDKTRGRHLVSTKNIKIGSVLIIDEPFSFSTDCQSLATNCLHCHVSLNLDENVRIPCFNCQTVAYCSNECRQDSWMKYHKYECTIFDYFYEPNVQDGDIVREQKSHLLLAWRTTIEAAIDKSTGCLQDSFLNYQLSASNEDKGNREIDRSIDPYDSHDYSTVYALETHRYDSSIIANLTRSLRSIFLTNCLNLVLSKNRTSSIFPSLNSKESLLVAAGILRHIQAVDCNAYEIVENARDRTTRIWEPRNIGGAIYTTVSLVNHACYPNVVRHSYPCGKVVVRALRSIPKGTEILDCYGPHFVSDSISARKIYLQNKYHFHCSCEACVNDFKLPDENLVIFKCTHCDALINKSSNKCTKCNKIIDLKKLEMQLGKSIKKRVTATRKMFEGNYVDALPFLIDHATIIENIVAEPNLEIIKTQQSIIQCWNSLSSVCPSN